MNEEGVMQTGWLTLEDHTYYLSDSGQMIKGWKKIDGSWYYFRGDGSMAVNETVEGYELDETGKMKE
jgi:glucan-binding YG repeat protein